MIGWLCVHTIAEHFAAFQRFIPWIALVLLLWIGGGMLREGIRPGEDIQLQVALRDETGDIYILKETD